MIGRSVHLVLDHSLDPLFSIYPPLAFYLFGAAAAVAGLFHALGPASRVDPTAAYLAGRAVSALAFVAAVAFVSATRAALDGRAAGLVAGAALALAPLAVRQAHFATTDGVATAFVAAAIWAAGRRAFLAAGVLSGLAAATRYNAGLVALVPLAVALLGEERWRRAAIVAAGSAVAFAGVVALAGHPADYVRGLAFLGGRATGQYGTPIGLVYHPTVSLPYGLGFGTYVLALAGVVLALVRRRPLDVALLVFLAASLAVTGFSHEVFWRYVLPVLPALCLLAGGLLGLARGGRERWLGAGAALLLMAPSAYASVMTDRLLGAEDTRQQAAEWLLREAPAGSELRIDSYWGQPFYDAAEQEHRPLHDLYLTGNPVADSFEQGRFTDRFAVNQPGTPCFALVESGPPWQGPLPRTDRPPLAVFTPSAGSVSGGVYDPLDAFYLPIWGFDGIQRPGPSIAIVSC
jgi:hypothetical protein